MAVQACSCVTFTSPVPLAPTVIAGAFAEILTVLSMWPVLERSELLESCLCSVARQ